jgi:uncharacterized membrane protein
VILGWLALACAGPEEDDGVVVDSAPPDCEGYDWDTVGAPFLYTWCTPCHSATTADRHGAPEAVDLETLEAARTWAPRIEQRAIVERTMPPAGGPLPDELDAFATWLACGQPG